MIGRLVGTSSLAFAALAQVSPTNVTGFAALNNDQAKHRDRMDVLVIVLMTVLVVVTAALMFAGAFVWPLRSHIRRGERSPLALLFMKFFAWSA
eukprot:gene3079-3624_t